VDSRCYPPLFYVPRRGELCCTSVSSTAAESRAISLSAVYPRCNLLMTYWHHYNHNRGKWQPYSTISCVRSVVHVVDKRKQFSGGACMPPINYACLLFLAVRFRVHLKNKWSFISRQAQQTEQRDKQHLLCVSLCAFSRFRETINIQLQTPLSARERFSKKNNNWTMLYFSQINITYFILIDMSL